MMGAQTQNYLQNVGTCPTYPPQLVTEKKVSQKNLNHPHPLIGKKIFWLLFKIIKFTPAMRHDKMYNNLVNKKCGQAEVLEVLRQVSAWKVQFYRISAFKIKQSTQNEQFHHFWWVMPKNVVFGFHFWHFSGTSPPNPHQGLLSWSLLGSGSCAPRLADSRQPSARHRLHTLLATSLGLAGELVCLPPVTRSLKSPLRLQNNSQQNVMGHVTSWLEYCTLIGG